MTDINEVRERLERLADNAEQYGLRVLARPEHVRALLDDHARLQRLEAAIKKRPECEFFVVWNSARNEGFITSDKRDAEWVASGRNRPFTTPTVGEAFREAYAEDGICPAEVICLHGEAKAVQS